MSFFYGVVPFLAEKDQDLCLGLLGIRAVQYRIIKNLSDFEECSECRISPALQCLLTILYSVLLKRKLPPLMYVSLFCLSICIKFMAIAPFLIWFIKAKGKFPTISLLIAVSSRETLGELLQGLGKLFSQKYFRPCYWKRASLGRPVTDGAGGAAGLAPRLRLRSAALSVYGSLPNAILGTLLKQSGLLVRFLLVFRGICEDLAALKIRSHMHRHTDFMQAVNTPRALKLHGWKALWKCKVFYIFILSNIYSEAAWDKTC